MFSEEVKFTTEFKNLRYDKLQIALKKNKKQNSSKMNKTTNKLRIKSLTEAVLFIRKILAVIKLVTNQCFVDAIQIEDA